jgi:hypothetical protein
MVDRPWLLLSLCAFMLSSCSSDRYVHRHKKAEEFLYDYNKCDQQVNDLSNSGRMPLGGCQLNLMIEECLQKEGWRKVRR